MRHPTDGTLRRLLDEPAGVAEADREHVAGCPACLAGLAAARDDAAIAEAALAAPARPDVDAGWHRLSASLAAERRAPAPVPARRWRALVRRPAIAALGVLLVLGGAGAAAAADWLQIFRTEQIAPVTVTQADLANLAALPDLSAYGTLRVARQPDVHPVAGAAAAEQATGLAVPQVGALPRGVTGDPVYQVGGQVSAEFTFSAARAAQAAHGATLPPLPAGLDGARFRLVAGPGAAAVWSSAHGVPALVVARAVAPSVYSSGVPFATVRDYLLSLPGVPADLAAQLRSFSGDGTTLPLPVPAEQVTSAKADINGRAATVLTSRDGTMAGVVWVDGGVVTAVAGSLSSDEVLAVASDLR